MQALIHPLTELADYEEIVKNKRKGPGAIRILGCVNSQKTHMMYGLSDGCRYKVIICSSESKAKQIYEEYRFAIYGKSPQDTADRDLAGKIALAIIKNLGKEN